MRGRDDSRLGAIMNSNDVEIEPDRSDSEMALKS